MNNTNTTIENNNIETNIMGETTYIPYSKFAKRFFSEIEKPIAAAKMLFDAIIAEEGDDANRQEALMIANQYGLTMNTASTQWNAAKKRAGI